MELSPYNSKQQQKWFPRAILKFKFWFKTSKTQAANTSENGKRFGRKGRVCFTPIEPSEPFRIFDCAITRQPTMKWNVVDEVNIAESISSDQGVSLVQGHFDLARYGWYWGPLSKREAEEHLSKEPDGAFLVRDSSSNNHIYTLSLRSYSYTMHTHIEYGNGVFSLGNALSRATVPELIADALERSRNSILSYSVHKSLAPTPVRLLKPISRNMEVRSLMHLCRFVIRQNCNVNAIEDLPLPTTLKQYLLQGQY